MEVFTKEEREEVQREEMRDLLLDAFDGQSVLFEIYKKRGWLERIFTDKILTMDKDSLYLTSQVAEICETQDYVIKNKRRELLDYINPTVMGDGNSKIYRHNYISVFKLKMIHGLTGEGAEFTLPQLKEVIYGNLAKPSSEVKSDVGNDMLIKLMKKMDQFDTFHEMVKSGEFFDEIKKTAQESVRSYLLENSKDDEVKEQLIETYEKIISPTTTLQEKELLVQELSKLELEYPGQAFTINMYKNLSEERIIRYRQEEREIKVLKIKEEVNRLFEDYENTESEEERGKIREKLQEMMRSNMDLSFEIRLWFSTLGKEKKKKGFFSRLFS
ncbi:hypothetical protein QYF50_06585 [Paenibacillus vini]|uniref:hypothetical protein n=1 Tax=Paenibacillus vini TaxID=1476024 RepID=UPI0025B72740|nr:hypothetical protein [Paenibacillus vini]MDN4067558.1 hypothetical protein [Paenibacillus vini]